MSFEILYSKKEFVHKVKLLSTLDYFKNKLAQIKKKNAERLKELFSKK